jgi:hypothetical protein
MMGNWRLTLSIDNDSEKGGALEKCPSHQNPSIGWHLLCPKPHDNGETVVFASQVRDPLMHVRTIPSPHFTVTYKIPIIPTQCKSQSGVYEASRHLKIVNNVLMKLMSA